MPIVASIPRPVRRTGENASVSYADRGEYPSPPHRGL